MPRMYTYLLPEQVLRKRWLLSGHETDVRQFLFFIRHPLCTLNSRVRIKSNWWKIERKKSTWKGNNPLPSKKLIFRNGQSVRYDDGIIVYCYVNAFYFFDCFMFYVTECKQQLRTMKKYTQIRDIAHFKYRL